MLILGTLKLKMMNECEKQCVSAKSSITFCICILTQKKELYTFLVTEAHNKYNEDLY